MYCCCLLMANCCCWILLMIACFFFEGIWLWLWYFWLLGPVVEPWKYSEFIFWVSCKGPIRIWLLLAYMALPLEIWGGCRPAVLKFLFFWFLLFETDLLLLRVTGPWLRPMILLYCFRLDPGFFYSIITPLELELLICATFFFFPWTVPTGLSISARLITWVCCADYPKPPVMLPCMRLLISWELPLSTWFLEMMLCFLSELLLLASSLRLGCYWSIWGCGCFFIWFWVGWTYCCFLFGGKTRLGLMKVGSADMFCFWRRY